MNISGKRKYLLLCAGLAVICLSMVGMRARALKTSASAKGVICIDAGHGGSSKPNSFNQ